MGNDVQARRKKRLQDSVNERIEGIVASGRKNEQSHLGVEMDVGAVYRGVTVSWLSQVFDKNPAQVKRLLSECPPLHRRKAGFVYDLKQAVTYLVSPNMDMKAFIKNMKPEDLPVKLQDKYWAAKTRRLKYEEHAGQLWRTEKVQMVVGEMFLSIKASIQLWADTIDRQVGMTPEQRALLYGMADELQDQIYGQVEKVEAESSTPSVLLEEEGEDDEFDPIG